jgi:predicted nucleic acid-binding protein
MVLVDTSVWIEMHRRDGRDDVKLALQGLLDAYEATICGPVEMEFLGGARPHERERLQAWCNVLPYLRNHQTLWRKAAVNFALLRAKGIHTPWNDVLIATLSQEAQCRIYACDQHFELMAPVLNLFLYKPGYLGMYVDENDSL